MGIPFYGFDWHGETTTAVHWVTADTKRREVGAPILRHDGSGEAAYTYTDDDGVTHTVWFQDREAVTAKVRFLTRKHADLAGIAIWQMYGEDPRFWGVIRKGLRAQK
jgi:spore germination protein YaaH